MALPDPTSPQVLVDEILANARQESSEVLRRAEAEAAALLANAAAEADKLRQERLAQAKAEAERRTELILATVPVEAGRVRAAQVEALLESCRVEVRRRLQTREGLDYGETLIQLAAEAVGRMNGAHFVVKLSPADHARYGAGLAEAIAHRVNHAPLNLTLVEGPALAGGGVVVEDADARQLWDNGLDARWERLWPEVRRQLALQAGLFESGKSGGGVE